MTKKAMNKQGDLIFSTSSDCELNTHVNATPNKALVDLKSGELFCDQVFEQLELEEDEMIYEKEFNSCEFCSCRLNNLRLLGCRFEDCKFLNCDMSLSNISGTSFLDVEFIDCKLLGVDWSQSLSRFFSVIFRSSYLDNCLFVNMSLVDTIFHDCRLREVDFSESNLSRSSFSGSDLSGTRFANTNLTQADFRGAYNYSLNPHQNIVKKTNFSIPEVIGLLSDLDIIIGD